MKVLERLPVMTEAELTSLAANALARTDRPELRDDCKRIQAAIVEERERRQAAKRDARESTQAEIRKRLARSNLSERVAAAFHERPPVSWEVSALRAVAEHGGQTTEQLSGILGYSGGYMNMAFGTLCHDRQAWLGPPPRSKRADGVIYSALMVDFVERQDPAVGRRWTEWWLKPTARLGLIAAGVLAELS